MDAKRNTASIGITPFRIGDVMKAGTGLARHLTKSRLDPVDEFWLAQQLRLGQTTRHAAIAGLRESKVSQLRPSCAVMYIVSPAALRKSAIAMQSFGGYLGGALAPTVNGLIVQSAGSFVLALVVGAVIGVASAASYLFVVHDPITVEGMDRLSRPATLGAIRPASRAS